MLEADLKRREFITLLGGAAIVQAWPSAAQAQQVGKVKSIGFLRVGAPPKAWTDSFRQGLRDHGYTEGRDIAIHFGLASGAAMVANAAAELVRLKVDVIVASGTPSLLPAKNAGGAIPVVFVAAVDPVATGLVATLARPGGNVTGVTAMQADITGKRLELLRELIPHNPRIALLVRATSEANARYVQEAEAAARTLGVQLQVLSVRDSGELEATIGVAKGAAGLVVADDAVFTTHRAQIAETAVKHRLPTISGLRETVDAGGLMSYGPHYGDLYRRAATQVHKILQGARPAELAIEQPVKFELVLNTRTAKALSLTIPPALLARADELLE
jgi:putative ABC transport system substrate-binding protein